MKTIVIILSVLCAVNSVHAQRTGIKGQLYWMSPDRDFKPEEQNIPYQGIPLEIYVHQLTTDAEVDYADGKITKIHSPIVARLFCKPNGSFKVRLSPGQYSVFVRYESAFYGNLKDSKGNLSPAIITNTRKMAWITITIEYGT